MEKSINAWTIPGTVSFEDMFAGISAAGFEGIELNLDKTDASAHCLSMETKQVDFDRINALSRKYQLPVCGISTSLYGAALGSDDPQERESGKNVLRKQMECAAALGTDCILVVPGGIGEKTSIRQAYENSRQSLLELVPEIEARRIKVGLENVWNGFFASPTDMARFIDDFHCPFIGAYFDVGNVLINSFPEYWIEILDKRIFRIHLKDFLHSSWNQGVFVNLLQGDARWAEIMKALNQAGYDSYLTAELAGMPRTPDYLYETTSAALDIILNMG